MRNTPRKYVCGFILPNDLYDKQAPRLREWNWHTAINRHQDPDCLWNLFPLLPRVTWLFLYLAPCGRACPAVPSPLVWQMLGGQAGSWERRGVRGAHTGSLASTAATECPAGQEWDSWRWAASLSLHTQTSQVGVYSSTGEPKWPIWASKSTAFSVGLVAAYRREEQKNQVCDQLATMWHLLLWAERKQV